MNQRRIDFEVDSNEVYRCKGCLGAARRIVWISTGQRTMTTERVFVYCQTCDKTRWQIYK